MLTERSAAVEGELNPIRDRIHADGTMADLTRNFSWQQTGIGPISGWSESLICAVNLLLESRFPSVLFWGPEMLVLYNDAYQPLMAEKHPRALAQPARECWSEAWHIIGPQFEAVLGQGKSFYFESVLVPVVRHGSLSDVYWTYSYSPVRETGGAIGGILIVCQDVTAKLAAERERDAIAERLKAVLESTTDGLALLDRDWRYAYVNERGARISLMRPEQMLGKSLWELFPHAQESQFGQEYRRASESGRARHFSAFYPEPLNAWIECHCYPGEQGLSVYFRDVTEQKQTELALRVSESRFRKLFESDLMGVAIPDRFGAFREGNDELLRMTGYTRAELEAGLVRWDVMTPPEYAELDAVHIGEAAVRGSCTPYEKEYIRKDGTRVPILCGYALLESSEDEYIGFVLDLSHQKRAERELREREERFRVLAESLPQLIWMTDHSGGNIYCNQRFIDYFGLAEAEMMGFGWTNLIHPDDLARTTAIWSHCTRTGELYLNEYRLRRRDGAYRHFLARAVPLKDASGAIERWIGSSTDIHDQKLAEDALRKSEKLATAGRLAASIAHEINNPLAGVTNSLYLALLDDSLRPETRSYLRTAESELRRVAQITTQTLRFHKQSNSPVNVDVCDIVDSVLALFEGRLAQKKIVVSWECKRGAFATCLGDEVRQVVANLVSNAMDAMGEGGRLRIRARSARRWTGEMPDGVRIVVADTGCGIPPAVLDRIFDAFVTTKDATGVGLGLWVSEGIVRKHGGRIRVRSRLTEGSSGTVFSVFLPATAETDCRAADR
jgi:PAS domain S-box-containing protein